MIEQRGKVVAVDEAMVWVSHVRQSACHSCSNKPVCGNSLLENWTNGRMSHIQALCDFNVEVGDEVVIGIDENLVLRASLFIYALPILLLLLGCMLGYGVRADDLGAGLGALLGLTAGFAVVFVHNLLNRYNQNYKPQVVGIAHR